MTCCKLSWAGERVKSTCREQHHCRREFFCHFFFGQEQENRISWEIESPLGPALKWDRLLDVFSPQISIYNRYNTTVQDTGFS
jgi:hypothetical protein